MKKRILSLILALSMVLSVLPLGAFAEGSSGELVMGAGGYPVCPDGTTGDGWEYKGGTLILKSGSYDFNYFYPKTNGGGVTEQTVRCEIKLEQNATITGGDFEANVTNDKGTISGGFFASGVTNSGTITGNGTFAGTVTNITGGTLPGGTISGGTFYGSVTNLNTIEKGTFEGNVTNSGTISGGTFAANKKVENYSYIENGTFEGSVTNYSTIEKGTFNGTVTNEGANATIKNGTFNATVTNNDRGKITDGTFNGTVENFVGTISGGTFVGSVTNKGTITSGTFNGKVTNYLGRTISGGTFKGTVNNDYGTISGGTFAAGLSKNNGSKILGGIFNGNANLTGAYHVTVTDGSVSQVNGEGPLNADGTPGTAWDLYSYKDTTMTITADTEIFSLNGQPISADKYGVDKKTVTFTMPDDKDVVLNKAIISTDLVMKGGYPEASNGGTIPCSGTGWSYDSSTKTLTLTDGTFDFNSTHPQGKTPGTSTTTPVACAIQSYATITGGIFAGSVTNDTEGMISGNGTFKGEVKNHNGTISGGKFEGTVINDVNGTISDGTFNKEVSNINGNISNGTFNETVTNDAGGTIYGGTFAGGVNNKNDRIYGGVFNGNATLTNVTGLHSITVASGAKIKEVNDVSAVWDPYVVTSNATTKEVTITADTDIFSLNGQPIAESSYGSDKKNVTFTMPDDKDVVLNGAITSTDLVMENGWPKDSNGGKTPCKGDGWEYIPNHPTNGDMLLLTGSNQTGGLFDFSTIGDGSAVECNVFVGKPTAITGGEFNGKVFNNSGILGGTFHGEVDNMGPGRIVNGTFHGAVENKGMIENGAFHDAVENNGTINDGTFHGAVKNSGTINGGVFNGAVTGSGTVSESITGSGTLNGEPITKTEPEPEPEPTTYTVTVIGGTIDGKTSVSAKKNDTLTVVLDQSEIPDGMTFDMWSISSSKLSGDVNVDYRAEAMPFKMPAEDVTIRAQYRSAEIIEDAAPSPLATAATIAVGGAAAGIVVWQGVSLGVDLYLANALPQGVPVPTDRRALALLLWETAGKPEVALPTLYGDIPTEEIELQKATRWAVQNGLMDAADKKDASFFDPDHYVTKMDVFGAWLRLKKLLGTT